MNVLYYYFYLFYTKKIPEPDPHGSVVFVLSLIISWYMAISIGIFFAFLSQVIINKWYYIANFVVIWIMMYFKYLRSGKGKQIVENEKPMFFNNERLSIIISIAFGVGHILLMFIGPIVVRFIRTGM